MSVKRICTNSICKLDYPHTHVRDAAAVGNWYASIDDPAAPAPWPDRTYWKRHDRSEYGHLFKFGWFASHSRFQLPWKLDCEHGLCDEDWKDLARLIARKFAFRSVYGIPKGGTALGEALRPYVDLSTDDQGRPYPVLIVDDVLTTGRSFLNTRAALGNPEDCIGVVVFARGKCPEWVWPILTVNEWSQSRAAGLG